MGPGTAANRRKQNQEAGPDHGHALRWMPAGGQAGGVRPAGTRPPFRLHHPQCAGSVLRVTVWLLELQQAQLPPSQEGRAGPHGGEHLLSVPLTGAFLESHSGISTTPHCPACSGGLTCSRVPWSSRPCGRPGSSLQEGAWAPSPLELRGCSTGGETEAPRKGVPQGRCTAGDSTGRPHQPLPSGASLHRPAGSLRTRSSQVSGAARLSPHPRGLALTRAGAVPRGAQQRLLSPPGAHPSRCPRLRLPSPGEGTRTPGSAADGKRGSGAKSRRAGQSPPALRARQKAAGPSTASQGQVGGGGPRSPVQAVGRGGCEHVRPHPGSPVPYEVRSPLLCRWELKLNGPRAPAARSWWGPVPRRPAPRPPGSGPRGLSAPPSRSRWKRPWQGLAGAFSGQRLIQLGSWKSLSPQPSRKQLQARPASPASSRASWKPERPPPARLLLAWPGAGSARGSVGPPRALQGGSLLPRRRRGWSAGTSVGLAAQGAEETARHCPRGEQTRRAPAQGPPAALPRSLPPPLKPGGAALRGAHPGADPDP